MDIHTTLIDLIRLEKNLTKPLEAKEISKKAKSLFTDDITQARTCNDAGIDGHWCACLKRTKIRQINQHLIQMADSFINHINNEVLKNNLDLCARLELSRVNHVYLLDAVMPKTKKLKPFSLKERIHSFMNSIFNWYLVEPDLEIDYKKYLFQIVTKPNNGTYEFTIVDESSINENKIKQGNQLFEIDQKVISRIDKYGHQSNCIEKRFPELRKYCFCKL